MFTIFDLQWYDWVRILTIVTSLLNMYLLMHTYYDHQAEFTSKVRDRWLSKNLFLFAALVSALESIVVDRTPSLTLYLICFAVLFSLRATFRSSSPNEEVPPNR